MHSQYIISKDFVRKYKILTTVNKATSKLLKIDSVLLICTILKIKETIKGDNCVRRLRVLTKQRS